MNVAEECMCASCCEVVGLWADCFCDRIEKNQLTDEDKRWLQSHPKYLEEKEKLLDIPDDLNLEIE